MRAMRAECAANIMLNPHDWGPWLEFADNLYWARQPARAQLIRATYAVLHGQWGDQDLHGILRKAADSYIDMQNPISIFGGLAFALCPPGMFVMGDAAMTSSVGAAGMQQPVAVTLTHGFWLGVQPVTRRQWARVLGRHYSLMSSSPPSGLDLPQTHLAPSEIREFISELNKRHPIHGWRFDLPTEAQWEYACRAGTNTAYAFGDQVSSRTANCQPWSRGLDSSGNYYRNLWNLQSMHGNVWERCRDVFNESLRGGVDPGVPTTRCTEPCMCRGGSYIDHVMSCCSSVRKCASIVALQAAGFRVALVVDV